LLADRVRPAPASAVRGSSWSRWRPTCSGRAAPHLRCGAPARRFGALRRLWFWRRCCWSARPRERRRWR